MATLHLISTQLTSELIQQIEAILLDDDILLFLSKGVYNILQNLPLLTKYRCYVLHQDVDSYGLSELIKTSSCWVIDYSEFVDLGIKYERSVSWH